MLALYRKFLVWLTGLSLVVVFLVVLTSSLSRYLLNAPFTWSEEIAKYAMIYGTMFGSILAYLSASHIGFTLVHDLLGDKYRERLNALIDLVVLAAGVCLTVSGYIFMAKRGGIVAPGSGIPMAYFQAAIMIGGAGLALAALIKTGERLRACWSARAGTARLGASATGKEV